MKTRILTSIVAICILLPILYFSGTVALPAAIAVVAVISIYEMLKCIGAKKLYISLPLYASAAVVPFLVRYVEDANTFATIAFSAAAVILIYLFAVCVLSHGKFTFETLGTAFVTSLYIIAAYSAIVYIRDLGDHGKYLYLLIFIGAWVTDTFAYFSGMLLGKHKLIPDVSPKKTVEGSIGGTLFCAIAFVVFGIVANTWFGTDANFLLLALGGVFMAVIAQIGDLIMSVIKRHYGIKDYGKIFPGHGGMLDRFDSVLIVALGLAVMCMIVSLLGVNLL